MNHFEFHNFNVAYWDLVRVATENGEDHTPRGHGCRELRPAVFTVLHPRSCLYTGKSRKLNYRFYVAEVLSYLAGWGDDRHAELMCSLNPNIKSWLNKETGKFDSPYGPQLVKSLPGIIERLKVDRETRREVAAIWSPGLQHQILDTPCTISLSFYVNKNQAGDELLSMTAHMRSNDLNWGTPYDVAAFCTILAVVADLVGLPVGSYHHVADSLHVYVATPPKVTRPSEESWHLPVVEFDVPRHDYVEWADFHGAADAFLRQLHAEAVNVGRVRRAFHFQTHDPFFAWCSRIVREGRP